MPAPSTQSSNAAEPAPARDVTPSPVTIDLVTIEPADPQDAEHVQAWANLHARSAEHDLGEHGAPWTADELRGAAMSQSVDRVHVGALDRASGEWLGWARLSMALRDNTHLGVLLLHVDPDHRGRGVGSRLLDAAEEALLDHGRDTMIVETNLLAAQESSASTQFAEQHGYAVAQTVLISDQVLTDPTTRELVARTDREQAAFAEQAGYDLETSLDGIPEEWLEDRAYLSRRMSTDIPLGDLAMEEEDWDAERVRREYELALESRRTIETVVRHRASGRLVGFTLIGVSAGPPVIGYQQDTLVLSEHRGHGLGLALKARNAARLLADLPHVPRVRTYNADDNTHMLAVNRALGYEVVAQMQERQLRL